MALQEFSRITDSCYVNSWCDRCTIPLKSSKWKGVKVFYCKTTHHQTGFLCVRCALNKTRPSMVHVTEQDFDEFVNKKISK